MVVLVYIAVIAYASTQIRGTAKSMYDYLMLVAGATIVLLAICWFLGGGGRWRWGDDEDDN